MLNEIYKRLIVAAFVTATCLSTMTIAYAQSYSVNGSDSALDSGWSAVDVGWLVTPTSSFSLGEVGTDFGNDSGVVGTFSSEVTAVIFSGTPAHGLSELGSSSAIDVSSTGGVTNFTFANAISVLGNAQYFVAFENVQSLGTNITSQNGAKSISYFYDSGGATFGSTSSTPPATNPILNFYSTAAKTSAPEPSPLLAFTVAAAIGAMCFGMKMNKRSSHTGVN